MRASSQNHMSETDLVIKYDRLLRLIVHRTKKRYKLYRRVPCSDLLQSARIGLLTAVRNHDPSRSKLMTFIYMHARWQIFQDYGKRKQKDPVFMAADLGDLPQTLRHAAKSHDEAVRQCESDRIFKAFKCLPKRSAVAVRMKYGIGEGECTLAEIGRVLRVTGERARQIVLKAEKSLYWNMNFYEERKEFEQLKIIEEQKKWTAMIKQRENVNPGMRLTRDRATA